MATLYVSEFGGLSASGGDEYSQCAQAPSLQDQTVAIGGSSVAAAAAFLAGTRIVRVHTDAICSIAIGPGTPVATATKLRMAGNATEYFGVTPGHKIAVIANV